MTDPYLAAVIMSLSIARGPIDTDAAGCVADVIWREGRNRHVTVQQQLAFSAMDRAAFLGVHVCDTLRPGTYPWAKAGATSERQRRVEAFFPERVAWRLAGEIATLVVVTVMLDVPLVNRPCPGRPTYFDLVSGRPVPWKSPSYSRISCVLDGIAFYERKA